MKNENTSAGLRAPRNQFADSDGLLPPNTLGELARLADAAIPRRSFFWQTGLAVGASLGAGGLALNEFLAGEPTPPRAKDRLDPSLPTVTYGDGRFRFGTGVGMSFSPDGKLLATCGYWCGVSLWDVRTGELVRHFSAPPLGSHDILFSPDGKLLVEGKNHVRFWAAATGELLRTVEDVYRPFGFTSDGERLLVGGDDGRAMIIGAKTGELLAELPALKGGPVFYTYAALSPDDSLAVIRDPKNVTRVWDLKTDTEILRRSEADPGWHSVFNSRFTPDGRFLVSPGFMSSREIRVRDPRTLKTLRVFQTNDEDPNSIDQFPISLDFTPNGKLLVVAMNHGAVAVFDFATGKRVRKWQADQLGEPVYVEVSPDGKTIASTINRGPAVKLWDITTGEERFPHAEGGASSITEIAVLPEGRTLVSLDNQNRIVHRDVKTGLATPKGHWSDFNRAHMWAMCPRTGAVLSPEPRTMGEISPPAECQLWQDIKAHQRDLKMACFSADGERVAAWFGGRRYHVYDRRSGKQFGGEILLQSWLREGLALSADGKRLVAWDKRVGECWDVDAGKRLETPHWAGEWSFTPDGTLAVMTDQDVRLWDVDRRRVVGILADKPHEPGTIAFSPDGALMAQSRSGPSGEVVMWELISRRKIRVLRGARGGVTCLAFSPDGQTLYAGTESSLIVGWSLGRN